MPGSETCNEIQHLFLAVIGRPEAAMPVHRVDEQRNHRPCAGCTQEYDGQCGDEDLPLLPVLDP
ncbi:hypothetical protein ACIOTI_02010 [Streptomyces sp. NPDC087843]|uniref:hypothetical protein n=1 Tax=Streptomyces sp. NPDC087843 TaxID=3365804 RepID=UPI00380A3AF2